MSEFVGHTSVFSERMYSGVSALLGLDYSVIAAAGCEFATFISRSSAELMHTLSPEQFIRLSNCDSEQSPYIHYFTLAFACHLCVTSTHLNDFCRKFFGGDLQTMLAWVCNIGTTIKCLQRVDDLSDNALARCGALIKKIWIDYRNKSVDRVLASPALVNFLHQALRMCKNTTYALRLIQTTTLVLVDAPKTPDIVATVLSRGLIRGKLSLETQTFLYEHLPRDCIQAEEYAFLSKREFIDAFVAILSTTEQTDRMVWINHNVVMHDISFRLILLRMVVGVCRAHTTDAHALCQSLGNALLENSVLFVAQNRRYAPRIMQLANAIALDHSGEELSVTDSNVHRVLAATLMAMRLFITTSFFDTVVADFICQYEILQVVFQRHILLRSRKTMACFIPYAEQIEMYLKRQTSWCKSRKEIDQIVLVLKRALYAHRAVQIIVGLASLDLPALLTHEILEADTPNDDYTMHYKWRLITTVKHFR